MFRAFSEVWKPEDVMLKPVTMIESAGEWQKIEACLGEGLNGIKHIEVISITLSPNLWYNNIKHIFGSLK